MPFIQARLSNEHDKDLIEIFKDVSNGSERLRELVRLGVEYEEIKKKEQQQMNNKIDNVEPILIKMDNVKNVPVGVVVVT